MAPRLLGDGARGMFAGEPLESLADAWRLRFDEVREIEGDLRIVARVLR
jgi:riboflavin biosynthesis pyrimidine reductase